MASLGIPSREKRLRGTGIPIIPALFLLLLLPLRTEGGWAKGPVYGRITFPDGKPAVGVLVQAFDHDGRKDPFRNEPVGDAPTDANGTYSIPVEDRRWDPAPDSGNPDLFIVVLRNVDGKWVTVGRSRVYYDKPPANRLRINLRIPADRLGSTPPKAAGTAVTGAPRVPAGGRTLPAKPTGGTLSATLPARTLSPDRARVSEKRVAGPRNWQQVSVRIDNMGLNKFLGQCSIGNVLLEGEGLNLISRAAITDTGGQESTTVRARLDWPAFREDNVEKRNVGLEVACEAPPGNYQIVLYQRSGPVPDGSLSFSVFQRAVEQPPPVYHATITSDSFQRAFRETFAGAMFLANSCGPSNDKRNVIVNIPFLPYQATEPLGRYEERTTLDEKIFYFTLRGGTHTVCKVRSCVAHWMSNPWDGSIADGKMVVRVDVSNPLGYKMRGLIGAGVCEMDGQDVIIVPWGWDFSDWEIPDFRTDNLRFSVSLQPAVDSRGKVTYGSVAVSLSSGPSMWVPPGNLTRSLQERLEGYMGDSHARMAAELRKAFDNDTARRKLSDAMMNRLTGIDRVRTVSGSGSSLTVSY